jgi:diguanylate cyclase (GGDEF)-like protein
MPAVRGNQTISAALEAACAEEPIHIIGTIQPHGFVLVVDVYTTCIVQVSSGVARHWPGLVDSSHLLQCPVARWLDGLEQDPALQLMSLPTSGLLVLPFQPRLEQLVGIEGQVAAPHAGFECVGHRVGDNAILEFQPLGDPLPGASGGTAGMDELRAVIARLRTPKLLDVFYRECAREIARISGFDRVMLYRFRPDWSGEVIAERASRDLKTRFLGLRFPATDIPSQARALFASSKVRVLADVLAPSDLLVPPMLPGGLALDQTYSLLRGVSEVHRTYLGNMGVRATMSLSIMIDGKLWGLIACHHYEPRTASHLVINGLRHVCELIAEIVALRIEALSQLESTHNKLVIEHLLNRINQALMLEERVQPVLDRCLSQLLLALGADGFYASVGGLRYAGGSEGPVAPRSEVFDEVARRFETGAAPSSVLERVDLRGEGGTPLASLPKAAGLLAAHQVGEQLEFCAFTRAEVATEVSWAGAPTKFVAATPDGRIVLEPRRSFEVWKESVAGQARDWSRTEAEACERLLRILSDSGKRQTHAELQQILVWRAHHDHLTGLLNRRTLEERLAQHLSERRDDIALMLMDLDNFKMINDTKGHAAGDRLLQELSKRLTAVIRPTDTLARVGGDEFMLLANMAVADRTIALQMAVRLHAAVIQPFDFDGHSVRLSISIGIAIPPMHGTNAADLMRRADLALYSAKKLGRSRAVVFDPTMELASVSAYEVERDLHDAIAKEQLWLAFQPEVDLSTGRVVGLEALARWQHPTRGAIGPGEFIPIAEHSGLITQIGQWVVRNVVATQAEWRREGLRSLPVAVNVSMTEVTSGRLVDHIGAMLGEFGMSPECLGIELTESVIMSDPGLALKVLRRLRNLGITTALDDFGTGYSSLSYLRQLPLTCLKVDRSFTASLTEDEQSRSLTQAIIRMADSLNMATIAEGVETPAQLQWLVEHDCNIGQGFLFSHPVPAAAVHGAVERIEAAWRKTH